MTYNDKTITYSGDLASYDYDAILRDKQRNINSLYELADYYVDADPIFRGIINGVYVPFSLSDDFRLVGANEQTKAKYLEYYDRIHLKDRMRSIFYQYFKYGNVYCYLMEDGNIITLPVHLVRIANVMIGGEPVLEFNCKSVRDDMRQQGVKAQKDFLEDEDLKVRLEGFPKEVSDAINKGSDWVQMNPENTFVMQGLKEDWIMTCGRGACFHTGLFSHTYKGIYAYFIPNRKDVSLRKWHFKDFCEENSPLLKYTVPLPQRPQLIMNARSEAFHPGWPIRVNARHILEDAENLSRIPQALQSFGNLPLLLDAAVELGRRQALAEPGIIAPQFYHGRMQFLMPLYLSGRQKADLAMALSIGDGYYIGETCLTPQMAYLNARLLARPTAGWLRELT